MADIRKEKRSIALTYEQWWKVAMCIAQTQSILNESREYWEHLYFDVNFRGTPEKREKVESMAKSYKDEIEKLEEIRMTIGGDVSDEAQESINVRLGEEDI